MTILLVEDEASLASFIQKGIAAEGYDMKVAFDGLIGQRLYDQQPFDVVVLDVNLPGLNGFELCRYIKQHSPRQPVLLLTALDGLADKEAGFGAGADDYLTKPFEFRELLLRIRALARRGEAYSGLRVADLEFDTDARTVTRAGQHIDVDNPRVFVAGVPDDQQGPRRQLELSVRVGRAAGPTRGKEW
ncbi:response regulator transcription factor [Hymenobacter setariae]|jgi:DNA-binding response OmpR family regulator|uniref:response regulator transcription factor n=1 Tax=Hymenobacter setariae TaxID=2594794 RepID=UPI001F203D58|nr:response regulator transcription factor [Hymenobacter setariae]